MLTKIRPAAFVALILVFSAIPASLKADELSAYDWLNIALNGEALPADNKDNVLTQLKRENELTKARPGLVDKLKAFTTGVDGDASGEVVWSKIENGLKELIADGDMNKVHYVHVLTPERKDEITLADILAALQADIGEEKSPWKTWQENETSAHAATLRKFLEAQFGKAEETREEEPAGDPEEETTEQTGHGDETTSAPIRGNAISANARRLWNQLDDDERKAFKGGLNEFSKLVDPLYREKWDSSSDSMGRIEAGRKLAEHFPKSIEKWNGWGNEAFKDKLGFDKADEKFQILNGLREARDDDDQTLFGNILDESRTNVERRVAKEEFDRRKAVYDQKFKDFPNMREDLVQYYGGKTDSLHDPKWGDLSAEDKIKKMQAAAGGFATLLGTVSNLKDLKARGGEDASLYDQRLGKAAQLAEDIRTNKIRLTNPDGEIKWENITWEGKPGGNSPPEAFDKQFVLDYLKVHRDNLKFESCVDTVNAGPAQNDAKFKECKTWLNENYSGANLQDYINTKLEGSDDDKVEAARAIVATGLKKDGNAYVLDLDVADTDTIDFTDDNGLPQQTVPPTASGLRLVVGKEGQSGDEIVQQVVAALDGLAHDAAPEDDTFIGSAFEDTEPFYTGVGSERKIRQPKRDRGRLGSLGLVSAGLPLDRAKDVSRLYYMDENGKLVSKASSADVYGTTPKVEKATLPVPEAKKPVWLPKAPAAAQPQPEKQPDQTTQQPTQKTPKVVWDNWKAKPAEDPLKKSVDMIAAQMNTGGKCATCHGKAKGEIPPMRTPQEFLAYLEAGKFQGYDSAAEALASMSEQYFTSDPAMQAALKKYLEALGTAQ